MTTLTPGARTDNVDEFLDGLKDKSVTPLWTQGGGNVPLEPRADAVPYVWRYREVRDELVRAGELVSTQQADRRVLGFHNPGLKDLATTDNLFAGLQLVLPGETETAHRHTAAAIRFVTEGSGAHTTVNGERAIMHTHDLILTANWQWHDHANESAEPIIWMDGLDMPLIRRLKASFFEEFPGGRQQVTKQDDESARTFGSSRLNPRWWQQAGPHSPITRYPWADVENTLDQLPTDPAAMPPAGYVLEYTNPCTGGSLMPTLACQIEVLPPDAATLVFRRMNSTVYNVVRGHGRCVIDGSEFEFGPSDVIAVPIWSTYQLLNSSPIDDLVLFALTDRPVYEKLGLYREQLVAEGDEQRSLMPTGHRASQD